MRVVLLAATGYAILTVAVYAIAGRWVAVRTRRAEERADRILARAHRRSVLILCSATLLGVITVLVIDPPFPRLFGIFAAYLGPFLWLWALIAGASWLELAARGLDVDLWSFHRFDVFAAFLLVGQRIPFFSAAFVAEADLRMGRSILPSIAFHLALAVALGIALRWLVVGRLVKTRPFPDLVAETHVARTARRTKVRLRRILLVPTERGQSVNALAATSSRTIYVAEGLVLGLDRNELEAVLLHELGHFAQPLTNAFRNAAVLGWPAVIWGLRALSSGGFGGRTVPAMAALFAAGIAGSFLASAVYRSSERRADRFAARLSRRGALAAALRKMYDRPDGPGFSMRGPRRRLPALEERLEGLERTTEKPPAV